MWSVISTNSFAQIDSSGSIRGRVIADSTENPLEFVNVLLLRVGDSSLVMGASTGADGKFEMNTVSWGEYFVNFNRIGYKLRRTSRFTIDAQHRRLNLGTITLVDTSVNMEEVTVTAERSPFVSSIDRMTYYVDRDVTTKAASASELLENIPSVQVDLNGEVSLRGSKRVLLMINGKRSPILERQEGIFLEQLPANSIERIEVITTPSARYRAEGKSGIINIVLKKDVPLGTQGNLDAHASNDSRYNGNVRVNYSPGNYNLYGTYSIRRDNHNRINSDVRYEATRSNPDSVSSIYTDNLYEFSHPMTHLATLGFDYRTDSLNSFGISFNYFRNSFTRTDSSYRLLQSPSGAHLSEYVRSDSGNKVDQEYGFTFNYLHNFSRQDHKLHIEAVASRSPETDSYNFTNTYISPTFPTAHDNSLTGPRDDKASLSVDYSNVLSKTSSLEVGYLGDLSRTDLNYYAENYDLIQRQFVPDPAKTSRYSYHESIHSVYAAYKESFGKVGMLAGFRVESASNTSELLSLDSAVSNSYWNIFPSLHLSYPLSKPIELRLSYSRRISRPKARDLDPFAEYRDPKNITHGNPYLVPEYIHSLEFGFQIQGKRIHVLPSVFYRYATNDISSIKRIVNLSTLQTTKENVASDRSVGLELICSWRAGDFFSTRLSTTALNEQLDASNIGNGKYQSNVSWSGTFTATANVAKDSRFEIHSHWSSLRLSPQGEHFPNAVANLGFRQELLEDKLSLTVTLSDIFKTFKRHDELDIPRLQQTVINTRESRVFFLGFTYRLGTIPKKFKEDEFRYDEDE